MTKQDTSRDARERGEGSQLPPTGQKTAHRATQAPNGSTDASGTVSGAQTGVEGREG
jgi:hypothetical protein